jgi:hypothetical protein
MNAVWQQRFERSSYLIGAIFFHVVLFLLIATLVVFAPMLPHSESAFQQVSIAPPPKPPPPPPAPSAGGARNALEPATVVMPAPAAPTAIMSQAPISFDLPAPRMKAPNLPASMTTPIGASLGGHSGVGVSGDGGSSSVFGSPVSTGNSEMVGYMYDLKQTADGKPTAVTADSYSGVVDEYISHHWDESLLEKYYRYDKPIFAAHIFIPNMSANNGPKAFGAQDKIQPSRWLIHYRAKVAPPEPGSYRFWGIADDIIAVAADGRTVLVGNRPDMRMPKSAWKSTLPDGAQAADGNLRAGAWVSFQAGESATLDVIIGERPGGQFNAFLLVEKMGETYPKDAKGHPILPIFQLSAEKIAPSTDLSLQPIFNADLPSVWTVEGGAN